MLLPDRLFTWVDVDAHLSALASAGRWPNWLHEVAAFWDGLELSVLPQTPDEVVAGWLPVAFGANSIRPCEDGWELLLEDVPGRVSARSLPVVVDRGAQDAGSVHRSPRWQETRIVPHLARPLPPPEEAFPGGVSLVGFHSFKGGVGRTLHAVALARAVADRGARVLLVDADLEAPGITWMFERSGKKVDISLEDVLALLHSSTDGRPELAVELAGSFLPNQIVDEIVVLPSRRRVDTLAQPRVQPADLLTGDRSPYYLTQSLAELAVAVGAQVVIVDLRAGASELSAPVLLDPRVQRVFVSSISSQSVDGVRLVLGELTRRAPARGGDPAPLLLLTQFPPSYDEDRVAQLVAPLLDAAAEAAPGSADVDEPVDRLPTPVLSVFQEALLGLPPDWDSVLDLIRRARVVDLLGPLAGDLVPAAARRGNDGPGGAGLDERRRGLAAHAPRLAYAETTDVTDFLATDSLRNLVSAHRTEPPLAVVVGSKGAGKTFTHLQMCRCTTWDGFAAAVGVPGVRISDALVPALTSRNLTDRLAAGLDAIRDTAAVAGHRPLPQLDLRARLAAGVESDLNERQWRGVWFSVLLGSIGVSATPEEASTVLADLAATERRIFVVDGLEDQFQAITTDPRQQRALRVLVTDCLEWLRGLRGRPFGLVALVRADLIRAAVPQNSAQLLARHKDVALRWGPTEAVRLAYWVVHESGALPGADVSAIGTSIDDLTDRMAAVWGEKMGGPRSREARSLTWFLAALSDFNDNIQARDVVTFLAAAAAASVGAEGPDDRLLTPAAMRSALLTCSKQKIEAIGEETPRIGELLRRLRYEVPADARQVPFTQAQVGLTVADLSLLAENGIVYREGDQYWMPEIFRQGLEYRALRRPRVLGLAARVRNRAVPD